MSFDLSPNRCLLLNTVFERRMPAIVLPGDAVQRDQPSLNLRSGPGIIASQNATDKAVLSLVANKAGVLGQTVQKERSNQVESVWVQSQGKRVDFDLWEQYTPALGDQIIGVILARHAEGYRVDIGSSQAATLDALAFEGATKRSKPNLKVGAVVYARIALAHPFAEPEIECIDPATQKAQGLGELTGGMLVKHLDLQKCRLLLSPQETILSVLGQKFPFEVAVGLNGRVWINSAETSRTIELYQTLVR